MSLQPFSSFPVPGDLSVGYQVVDVTGMVAVYMLKSYPENQLCDIVCGDGIVLLVWCSTCSRSGEVKKEKCQSQISSYGGTLDVVVLGDTKML